MQLSISQPPPARQSRCERQQQVRAGQQTARIATAEGARVEREDAIHQCLLRQRAALLAQTRGNQPETVATSDLVTMPGRRTRRRERSLRCSGHNRGNVRLRSRHRARRSRYGGIGRGAWWIQQHGVLSQKLAVGPGHFNDEIQVGFAHRTARHHPDHAARAAQQWREAQIVEEVDAFDTRTAEDFGRSQSHAQVLRPQIAYFKQLDFSLEGLVQRRMQRDLTQTERRRHS